MKCFGWTNEQIAYAIQRYRLHGEKELLPDANGILDLHDWWYSHDWPDPLTVRLEGVVLEYDYGWAAEAVKNFALRLYGK